MKLILLSALKNYIDANILRKQLFLALKLNIGNSSAAGIVVCYHVSEFELKFSVVSRFLWLLLMSLQKCNNVVTSLVGAWCSG